MVRSGIDHEYTAFSGDPGRDKLYGMSLYTQEYLLKMHIPKCIFVGLEVGVAWGKGEGRGGGVGNNWE